MYYVDTCIYLNLFKKERGLWKYAEDFFKRAKNSIIYSALVEKEFVRITGAVFVKRGKETRITQEDAALAKIIYSEFGFRIGFADCMHIAICKNNEAMLVTRDKELTWCASKYVRVTLPEKAP